MSAETKAALEQAIRNHVADEREGDVVASWVVITEHVNLNDDDDEMTHVLDIVPDMQSSMTTLGLTHFVTTQRTRADG